MNILPLVVWPTPKLPKPVTGRDAGSAKSAPTGQQRRDKLPKATWSRAAVALIIGLISSSHAAPHLTNGEKRVTESDRQHWAFTPLKQSVLPESASIDNRGANPIDRFWTMSAPRSGAPAPGEASRAILIRRLNYAILGLPPTPESVDGFQEDRAPDAYDRLVDQLLANRHYGERWGRHWLDLARYADSNGYEDDDDRKFAWPYRDWVIRALNSDLPFNIFVRWQLAGDEYDPDNADAVVATGFLAAALSDRFPPTDTAENKLINRYNELDDVVATSSSALLALTVGCARCHDHKFDPIPTRDYYRMLSAFTTSRRAEASLSRAQRELTDWRAKRKRAFREERMGRLGLKEEDKIRIRHREFDTVFDVNDLTQKYGELVEIKDEDLRASLGQKDLEIWSQLEAAATNAKRQAGNVGTALIFLDVQAEPLPEFLLRRGSVRLREERVTLGFLEVLSRGKSPQDYWTEARSPQGRAAATAEQTRVIPPDTTFQRKALAEWITDTEHGAGNLLARVIVNRLWQHHFGEGLVGTANDFGSQGDLPINAALLGWLASELIRQGWQLKPIHRLILTSQAFKQRPGVMFNVVNQKPASVGETQTLRRRPLRIEAEVLRDSMLAVSGKLNRKMFGPPFRPIIPKEAMASRSRSPYPTDIRESAETSRRSIYAFVKRSVRNPMMEVFDSPDPSSNCGRRNTTTVPTQALTLMNDDFVRQCAIQFAQRVITEAGLQPSRQIERAYRLALGRSPSEAERQQAATFLTQASDAGGEAIPVNGLTDFCHALFTLNEFVYVD